MELALQITQAVVGALLVFLIMLHAPKGDGMASIGGAANLFSSRKSAEKGLTKLTWILLTIFITVSCILGLVL